MRPVVFKPLAYLPGELFNSISPFIFFSNQRVFHLQILKVTRLSRNQKLIYCISTLSRHFGQCCMKVCFKLCWFFSFHWKMWFGFLLYSCSTCLMLALLNLTRFSVQEWFSDCFQVSVQLGGLAVAILTLFYAALSIHTWFLLLVSR